MREGTFDISVLVSAQKRLGEAILRYQKDVNDDVVRDSVIQRFEFTYSITLKTLKKYFIERAFVVDDVERMSFNDMVRTACQLGLLSLNLEKWTVFRQMRILTSHTYYEKIAQQVVGVVPEFNDEIAHLIGRLEK